MSASGLAAQSSVLTCACPEQSRRDGRIDLVLTFSNKVYILEFKCNQSADLAIQQIQEKRYADPYQPGGKKIVLIGINFDPEKRNLAEWKIVRD